MRSTLPEAAPQPGAIRTFLIADIRGWTRFTRELGDEAASRLAAKFAQIVGESVEAWGGRLLELRGDEAMCTFESARRALRCAIELQEAFADESAIAPELPLNVGIGLDAGEAVPVGDGYRGTALNVAARLCSTAAAGEVVATASLAHLAGRIEGITFAELEAKPMKGFDQPVAAVLVDSAAPHEHDDGPTDTATRESPPPLPAELDAIVPLVGREPDLLWLSWHWRRARHGHGGAVAISGVQGIGRTRLAAELASLAHGEGGAVVYLRGANELAVPVAPALVVLDDVDTVSVRRVRELLTAFSAGWSERLVLVAHREPAPASLSRVLERIVPPARRRVLMPLGEKDVAGIAALYLDRRDDVPARLILEESGGIPAAAHRVASQWARSAVTRRLGSTAQRTAAERRELRAAEALLVSDLADLDRARERTLVYLGRDTGENDDAPEAPVACPYKGLATFEADDADTFFGRERLVGELIARLVGVSFLGLIGASGSGKSSVLRAGLLPAIASGVLPGSDRWTQVIMRPGDAPLRELGVALGRVSNTDPVDDPRGRLLRLLGELADGQRVILVIDQFEEIFSEAVPPDERGAFLDLVTAERSGLKVIVAMRADHYERAAAYPVLAKQLSANQILVGPVRHDEVRAIIEHPAARVGLRVDPELTQGLVDDSGTDPTVLPLLSTTLLELWMARDGRRLTLASYRMTGGLRGAVSRLAEAAYGRLTSAEQETARGLLLRLSGGAGETVTRRRVPLGELDLERSPIMASVVDALVRNRLLVAGDGYVEVAHEALLREWPRLRSWLEDDTAGRAVRLHLAAASSAWLERGRPPDDLYRGARLAAALDWADQHATELNDGERQFLDASRALAEAEARSQRRTNRRLRGLLAGAAVFLVAALSAGAYALVQADAAREQAARAEEAEARAQAEADLAERSASQARGRELAASAISYLEDNPTRARLLALVAASMDEPPIEAVSALHQAHAADIVIDTYSWPDDLREPAIRALIDPAGELIAASGEMWKSSDRVEVYEIASRRVLWEVDLEDEAASIGLVQFSPDGSLVAAGSYWTPDDDDPPPPRGGLGLHVWDARTGEELQSFDVGRCGGIVVGMSSTTILAMTLPDSAEDEYSCFHFYRELAQLEAIDLASGERQLLSDGVPRLDDGAAAISEDGRIVAFDETVGDATRSVVMDLATGEELLEIDPDVTGQFDAYVRRLNDDGSLLLYGDRPVEVWSVRKGEVVGTYAEHAGGSWYGTFATSETVVTTGRDASIRFWSAVDAETISRFSSLASGHVTVSDDGRALITDFSSRTALLVDPQRRGEVAGALLCPDGFTLSNGLNVRSGTLAVPVACDDPWIATQFILDSETLHVVAEHHGQTAQASVLSPDGARIAHQRPGDELRFGPIVIKDVMSGTILVELEGTCESQTLSVRAEDCRENPATPFWFLANRLSWSPDGTLIAGVARGSHFAVWDAQSGRLVYTEAVDDRRGFLTDAFFTPNQRHLIVTYYGRRVERLAVGTWEREREATTDGRYPDAWNLTLVGFLGPDEFIAYGMVGDSSGGLYWIDADTLEIDPQRSASRVSEASIKSSAMSPDRSLVAIGSSDGFVRVFDTATGSVSHERRFGQREVQGLAFLNDRHLIVAPQGGGLETISLDLDELLSIVRGSLSRGFTDFECQRFFPDGDCPTIEQLRAEPTSGGPQGHRG